MKNPLCGVCEMYRWLEWQCARSSLVMLSTGCGKAALPQAGAVVCSKDVRVGKMVGQEPDTC